MGQNLNAIIFNSGCWSYIENLELESSIDVISGILRQKVEDRLFLTYTIRTIMAEENTPSYLEFLKQNNFIYTSKEKVDIEQIRKKSSDVINKLKNIT